jgi:hypothetical protein
MANHLYSLHLVRYWLLYSCRYKDMDTKIRHHYEVIQEVSHYH